MKTLKSVVNQDERNAKLIGQIVNVFIALAGIAAIAYAFHFWAPRLF